MSTRKAKRPGTIEPPRGVINVTREKVVVESTIKNKPRRKTFIITTYDCENSITIYIGDYDVYCIDVQLIKNTTRNTIEYGFLTKARWDISCSMNEPFEKGEDTIMIIKLMLTYIHNKYPQVKYVSFTDMSTKECDDGSSVNLAAMKLLTDGKTWYEAHFNAVIDPRFKDAYSNMKTYADKCKTDIAFDKFLYYININNLPISKEELQNSYESIYFSSR
jgi:hypothetical protein